MKRTKEIDPVMEAMRRSVQSQEEPAIPENWTRGVMDAIRLEARPVAAMEMAETTLSIWPLAWAAAGAAAVVCLVSWTGWLEPDASLAWLWIEEPQVWSSLLFVF